MATSIISTSTSISTLLCPLWLPSQSQPPPFYDDNDNGKKRVFIHFKWIFTHFFNLLVSMMTSMSSTHPSPPQHIHHDCLINHHHVHFNHHLYNDDNDSKQGCCKEVAHREVERREEESRSDFCVQYFCNCLVNSILSVISLPVKLEYLK